MHDTTTTERVLRSLLALARADVPADAGGLARHATTSVTGAAMALVALEQRGLADAGRARLTFYGLAVAAALSARADKDGGRREPAAARSEPARAA